MKIKWNEVTRFSQIVAIILFLIVFFVGFLIGRKFEEKVFLKTSLTPVVQPAGTISYTGGTTGFSLYYPIGFTVDESYIYQELGLGKDINGVKFTIPTSLASGTNLGSDSYLSVEKIPQTQTCTANLFLTQQGSLPMIPQTLTYNGTTYSVASTTGAGAGNRYEETVYAIPGTNPCVAVRYFIHYGVFENYPAGSIKEFDQQALLTRFDAIRHTLTISK